MANETDLTLAAQVIDPIEAGQEAWKNLKRHRNWPDWKVLGNALSIGRTEAMAEAMTNRPKGRRYNVVYGQWLRERGFDDIKQTTRARLLSCVEHIVDLEKWLDDQDESARTGLNHPVTIWNVWQRALRKATPAPKKPKKMVATLAEMLATTTREQLFAAMPQNLREDINDRVVHLGGDRTGSLDAKITKLLLKGFTYLDAGVDAKTSKAVATADVEAALKAFREALAALKVIKRSPRDIQVVLANKQRDTQKLAA